MRKEDALERLRFEKINNQIAFYTSATGASYADDETGLYGQLALFIFGLFMQEVNERGG